MPHCPIGNPPCRLNEGQVSKTVGILRFHLVGGNPLARNEGQVSETAGRLRFQMVEVVKVRNVVEVCNCRPHQKVEVAQMCTCRPKRRWMLPKFM